MPNKPAPHTTEVPFDCPHFRTACEALALLERVAVALPSEWNALAIDLRLSAAAIVVALARAQAFSGQRRLALQRAARVRAFDISGAIMTASIVGGPIPPPEISAAAIAYSRLVRQLQSSAR